MTGSTVAELKAEGGCCPRTTGRVFRSTPPVAVKEAVLPFHRFRTREGLMVDSVLGPEMRSTGEVMGIDRDFPRAFAKSQLAAYGGMPTGGTVFVSVSDRDKRAIILPILRMLQHGFRITATEGTAEVLRRNGILADVVLKYHDKPTEDAVSVVELIDRGEVDIVVNTPSGRSARADGYEIRARRSPRTSRSSRRRRAVGRRRFARSGRGRIRGDEPAGVRAPP